MKVEPLSGREGERGATYQGREGEQRRERAGAGGRREDRGRRQSQADARLSSLSLQNKNDLGAEGARALVPALAALPDLTVLWLVSRHCVCNLECAILCWV